MSRETASKLSFSGVVQRGNLLGRTIGFPTANIEVPHVDPQLFGVYVCNVTFNGGKNLPGVCNLGVRPTIGSTVPLLEVHIFDFSDDIYTESISVDLGQKLRAEQRFDTFELLKSQLHLDKAEARVIHASQSAKS